MPLAQLQRVFDDRRLEVLTPEALGRDWVTFVRRVSGTLVASEGDPLGALTYAVTAGIPRPIVLLIRPEYLADAAVFLSAGATACVPMPVDAAASDAIVDALSSSAVTTRVEPRFRLVLDPLSRTVRRGTACVRLSPREFAVFYALSARGGSPVRTEDLLKEVWGETGPRSTQVVDVFVYQVRRKLERIGLAGVIATVRGFGYALSDGALA